MFSKVNKPRPGEQAPGDGAQAVPHRLHTIHQPLGPVHPESGHRGRRAKRIPKQGSSVRLTKRSLLKEHFKGDNIDKQVGREIKHRPDQRIHHNAQSRPKVQHDLRLLRLNQRGARVTAMIELCIFIYCNE
jgi:hypothetical protein